MLADYIEDPGSLARRIREHDHDWMFWLVEAAAILEAPGSEEAFSGTLDAPPDEACAAIIQDRIRPGQ